ncbi:MAG: serine/threonine-protein kinase [Anaerolineae bacterium]|nr:serine/threonine-protein kinase [Anaerolineae bacterium]
MNTQRLPGEQKAPMGADGSLQPGSTLNNRYRITSVLGVGGMGSVYLARDMNFTETDRKLAVKEMLNLNTDSNMRELMQRTFEREANILAALDHPAIPKIYDYFTSRDRAYLVMDYINGRDLEAIINLTANFIPFEQIKKWAIELCDVLDYLHNNQPPIVFRDIKPSNIMVDHKGRIRLIDFGIAKNFQANQKGTMIGTEGYSPPEQYRGEASPQGDIYALGASLHHLATRKDPRIEPPFSFHERPIRLINSEIPVEFERIVLRAVEYQGTNRFQSAAQMRDAISAMGGAATPVVLQPAPVAAPMTPQPLPTVEFQSTPATISTPPIMQPTVNVPAPAANNGFDEAISIQELWKFKCEDEIRGIPAFYKGVVYVGAYDNNLYAINADGSFRWKYPTEGGISSSPVISPEENTVIFGSEDTRLYGVDIRTGKVSWSFQTEGQMPVRSTATVAGGFVFFGADDGKFYALRVMGSNARVQWKVELNAEMRSRAAVTNDRIVVATENGEVLGLDTSGQIKWKYAKSRRAVTGWPLIDNNVAYFGSMDNYVHAVEIINGFGMWRARANKAFVGSPILVGKVIYIGAADNNLYAFDISSGRELWHFTAGSQIVGSPAHANGALYFGCVDHNVYSIEAKKGKLRWTYTTGGPITSSPCIVDKTLYIGSTDHHLYALSL